MKEQHKVILQIILVFILIICALIFKVIPEYQESKGSSDFYINTEKYTDIVEVKINNKPNFALVITEKIISNILFFDQESLCLYNQNVEGLSIEDGTKQIIELLIENDYLKQNYFFTITKYNGSSYEKVKNDFVKVLNDLSVTVILQENSTSIKQRAEQLDIAETNEVKMLKGIELISKDVVRRHNNNILVTTPMKENITETTSRDYTDTVYKKIENYVRQNNIINQDVTTSSLEITKIPANTQGTVFPDETSWYYIKDGAVYAYISITVGIENYSYCYQASIDVYKKGQC